MRYSGLAFLFLALLFIIHAIWLSSAQHFTVVDDAYISFRYIDQLLAGNGLVFNTGERVEGFSHPLWIGLLLPFRWLGWDLVRVSQGLGLILGLGVLWLTGRIGTLRDGSVQVGTLACLLLCADGSFVRWAIDGLETQLFTMLLLITLVLAESYEGKLELWCLLSQGMAKGSSHRMEEGSGSSASNWFLLALGCLVGLLTLTRPEGPLLLGAILLVRLMPIVRSRSVERGWSWLREVLVTMLGLLLIVGPYVAFRVAYYGDIVANPAYIKVNLGFVALVRGIRYGIEFLGQRWPILAALVACWIMIQLRHATRSIGYMRWGIILLIVSYIVVIGGDWMNRARFFVPIMPLFALLAANLLVSALEPVTRGAARCMLAFGLCAGLWYSSSWQAEYPWLIRAGEEQLERQAVVDWFLENSTGNSTLLTEEIGYIPYYTGLKTFDVYGLIDRQVARHGEFDRDASPGHQRTDLNYSLALEPTYLVMAEFSYAFQKNTASDAKDSRFPGLKMYERVPVDLPLGRLEIYHRKALRE